MSDSELEHGQSARTDFVNPCLALGTGALEEEEEPRKEEAQKRRRFGGVV